MVTTLYTTHLFSVSLRLCFLVCLVLLTMVVVILTNVMTLDGGDMPKKGPGVGLGESLRRTFAWNDAKSSSSSWPLQRARLIFSPGFK